ncbi:periplasmic binding protein and sugar binding domain of the LacI family protein [Bifidobacterium ramosum]|uniref:LacI family DNA-binding transcriptional regulator n=1 Tax=Bifidobacterium ramosum TaxID=1798158 RepID=A0A6L4WY34_9BIFI|nr:LacI family DNA-binding transcriptional regulator [Bifidobacterium ramosum]KAB8286980.1 periplasmic binding protein and sugar binding domain of the LacI family protein [Bifidobacterium ramosum]NEG72512.1 LacI family DNA-binding transcriptional regulator [Bifidobacterium ramosum]
MVTLKDVAERAGVSPATVSYTLRGGEHVSKWTEERVRAAARELGYSANMAARSLRYGKTGMIELVVRGLDVSTIYAKMVTHVKHVCTGRGYHSLVMQTEQDPQTLRDAVGEINRQSCDGMILDPCGMTANAIRKLNRNQPIVMLDDYSGTRIFDNILTPHEEMAYAATRHLIETGCRRIMLVGASREQAAAPGVTPVVGLRLRGFLRAMDEAGLMVADAVDDRMIGGEWRYFVGVDLGRELVDRGGFDADGLVCCNDTLALGVIRGLADRGVRVPDDVRVIGSDGITMGEFTVPRLSTVELDVHGMMKQAVDMLVDRIDGSYDGDARQTTASFALHCRESCGCGAA